MTADGKTVLVMHANLGWDKTTKSVFYVDLHDNDTVYTGHVRLEGGALVYDFGELHDPKPHYMIKMKFTDDDHYESAFNGHLSKMARVKD